MDVNNNTVVVVCATVIACVSLYYNNTEIPLAIAGGLVGYLAKNYNKSREEQ